MKVVNEIAPSKEIRIKNNLKERFYREIVELIHAREKLFLKLVPAILYQFFIFHQTIALSKL